MIHRAIELERGRRTTHRTSNRRHVVDGWVVLLAAVFLAWAPAAAGNMTAASAIQRLEDAIERHPDDPDLAYTLARKLANAGRASDAVVETRRYLARWPDRRPEARVEIARALIDGGRAEQAVALLDEEVTRRPRSATARFYRGIAHRSAGRTESAIQDFEFAGQLSAALRAESFLAQALGLFELGRDDEAVDLLRRIVELDPTSESAIRARLMLRQREMMVLERWWRLDAHAGFEWDDNVLLESATNESSGSDNADFRGVLGAGATARVLTTDEVGITLGYRLDSTLHHDLDEFDLLTNSAFVSGSLQMTDATVVRVDLLGWNSHQDGDNELTAGLVRPNLIVSLGPKWGALRGFAQFEIFEYDELPLIDAWERDGLSFGGGLEHFLPLPIERSFLSTSLSYQQNLTQARTGGGTSGFDGDNDHHSAKVRPASPDHAAGRHPLGARGRLLQRPLPQQQLPAFLPDAQPSQAGRRHRLRAHHPEPGAPRPRPGRGLLAWNVAHVEPVVLRLRPACRRCTHPSDDRLARGYGPSSGGPP